MIKIDGESLSLKEVERVASYFEPVSLSDVTFGRIDRSAKFIEELASSGKVIYGVTTGFGSLCDRVIQSDEIEKLQENLLKSHASGIGTPLPEEDVRAGIVVRANSLAKGYSGVRRIVIEKLLELLNKKIYPYVPSFGSVGASGDLAPLAHISLLLIGRGRVFYNGKVSNFNDVSAELGFEPLTELKAKEGLALINGTAVETGISSLLLRKAFYLVSVSLKAAALTLEVLKGRKEAFDARVQEVRGYSEQKEVAEFILNEIQDSKLVNSTNRVQDAYSLRCIPSVYGAVLGGLRYAENIILKELNAVTDNPIIFADDGDVISGGNFHAEPVAFAMDHFSLVLSEIGSISERRINRLLNPVLSGLPAFLVKHSGLNSGMMIVQYTAAALASMNKTLSHPASADSISVSADQEDHVSMGMNSVLKAKSVLENVRHIIAIELLVSAQAADFAGAENLGKGTRETYRKIRDIVEFADSDREFSYDIEKISSALSGRVI
jgi:histidine ammonia-lyase